MARSRGGTPARGEARGDVQGPDLGLVAGRGAERTDRQAISRTREFYAVSGVPSARPNCGNSNIISLQGDHGPPIRLGMDEPEWLAISALGSRCTNLKVGRGRCLSSMAHERSSCHPSNSAELKDERLFSYCCSSVRRKNSVRRRSRYGLSPIPCPAPGTGTNSNCFPAFTRAFTT